jgi:uncharacterized membrane protein
LTRLERSVGIVLRVGVTVSSGCLALGLALSLAGVSPTVAGALLQVGLVTLLCTPVARVIISTIEYVVSREWRFALLTLIVLFELMASAMAALIFNRRV